MGLVGIIEQQSSTYKILLPLQKVRAYFLKSNAQSQPPDEVTTRYVPSGLAVKDAKKMPKKELDRFYSSVVSILSWDHNLRPAFEKYESEGIEHEVTVSTPHYRMLREAQKKYRTAVRERVEEGVIVRTGVDAGICLLGYKVLDELFNFTERIQESYSSAFTMEPTLANISLFAASVAGAVYVDRTFRSKPAYLYGKENSRKNRFAHWLSNRVTFVPSKNPEYSSKDT